MLTKLKPLKGEHGFTLLELLVSIVIIGIIFAIATPVYANQIKNGLRTTVANDVKNISGEVDNVWNEDEGYPLCYSQKLSDGNTANYYINGVLVCSQGADQDSPTTTGTTPNSSSGGGGSYTGGSGSSSGTGGSNGSQNTTYRPATNRSLTWDEFKKANNYDTGYPAFSFAPATFGSNSRRSDGSYYADNITSWANGYNYTADKISSLEDLQTVLISACTNTNYGYLNYLKKGEWTNGGYEYEKGLGRMGQNACYVLREGTATQRAAILSKLAIYEVGDSNYFEAVAGHNNDRLSRTGTGSYSFPSTGTYSILINRMPTSLFCGSANSVGYDLDIPNDLSNIDTMPYQWDASSYARPTPYGTTNDICVTGKMGFNENLYDIVILHTGNTNTVKTASPNIVLSYPYNAPSLNMYGFQGGRDCSANAPGFTNICTDPRIAGLPYYQTDDLPEAWWKDYLNPSGGSGTGTNTDPSSTGSSGGSFAGNYVGSYFGTYCVEVTNKDLDGDADKGWQHYNSDDMKLKKGRCT